MEKVIIKAAKNGKLVLTTEDGRKFISNGFRLTVNLAEGEMAALTQGGRSLEFHNGRLVSGVVELPPLNENGGGNNA